MERLRILVVGNGGREHAFAWRLALSPMVDFVHVAPGNGGSESYIGQCSIKNIDIRVDDFHALLGHTAKHGINLVVPGPEAPLVAGLQNLLQHGLLLPSSR